MKIALVSMPFYSLSWASIQLGILKSVLERQGYAVEDHYLNLPFAKQIGFSLYEYASLQSPLLLGDWLFSHQAFGPVDPQNHYLELHREELIQALAPAGLPADSLLPTLARIKETEVGPWLDRMATEIDWKSYDVVGFSCTFMQTVASLALANRIKRLAPHVKIVFGGSALEGAMGAELIRHAPAIDCIVQGEGEHAIGEVVRAYESGTPVPRLFKLNRPVVLDEIPLPNYERFYQIIDGDPDYAAVDELQAVSLPLETSRGCWWGEKHHCKFCGLNGETMKFRAKSPAKVLQEMDTLAGKYNRYDFQAVDNIVAASFFKSLLPDLASRGVDYTLFFEVKANLSYADMKTLKDAGVHRLQPGIESLDTSVLRLMDKGVTAAQNLNLLRWARHFDQHISWNLLYGFPGETEEAYQKTLALIPLITHLQPPGGAGKLRMDRFSPYFSEYERTRHLPEGERPFRSAVPLPAYALTYPREADLWSLAYFYDCTPNVGASEVTYEKLRQAVANWEKLWKDEKNAPVLRFSKSVSHGHVVDSRSGSYETVALEGAHFAVAKALEEKPLSLTGVAQATGLEVSRCAEICEEMMQAGFVVYLDNVVVWLPVSKSYSPAKTAAKNLRLVTTGFPPAAQSH